MNVAAMKFDTQPGDAAAQLGENYHSVASGLPGGAGVGAMRDKAIAALAEAGLPGRRVEEWKYTDLRTHLKSAFPPADKDDAPISEQDLKAALGALAGLGHDDAHLMVFINGTYRLDRLNYGDGPKVSTLSHALDERAEWAQSLLGKVNPQEMADPVLQLNTAFMTDGAAVHIPAGVKLEKPLHLVFLTRGANSHSVATRNIISVEEGAEATIIEQHVTLGDTAFQTNSVTEMKVADGAKVEHIKLQDESLGSMHLATWAVDLGKASSYRGVHLATGAALSRHQLFLRFNDNDARGHYYGAQLMRGKQHCDMTLVIDHDSVGCESREHVKAVLDDSARGVFQAKVIVRPDAQQTDGHQMAQALLLSDNAEFDAKPELEIYADDVKCNHGATSGAIDEDLMFYLKARGIPEDEARAMLIQAFIGEILDQIENEKLSEAFAAKAKKWLG
ncbi:MAG TPA: Fe-S cluster assembly protein SufD [Hyphomicrobiales bacterium]|nr:Fe-S cluster assembly protein SufD [Hyphomicrobiales bacterium]